MWIGAYCLLSSTARPATAVSPSATSIACAWLARSIATNILAKLSINREFASSSADDDASAPEETFPCPHCGAPIPEIGMAHFSFNKPAGACPTCTGLGSVHQANIKRLVDEQKSIPDGAVAGWDLFHINYYTSILLAAAAHYGFELDLSLPIKDYTPPQRDLLFFGVDSPL